MLFADPPPLIGSVMILVIVLMLMFMMIFMMIFMMFMPPPKTKRYTQLKVDSANDSDEIL